MRKALLYIYTTVSNLIIYPYTLFCAILVLLFAELKLKKAIRWVLHFWAQSIFIIIGKNFKITGLENIDKDKKYLLMANHGSLFDIMGIMSICPSIAWFGRAHLLKVPIFGKLLQAINYIPMKSSDLKNTKLMIEKLVRNTENQTVAIFPEGTRTLNGEISSFRKGFLHVLKASKLEILPISLIGFYEFKPKDRYYFDYSKKLSAKVHVPIPYSEVENLDDKEIIQKVKTIIESPFG
ncbi:MAG: 1-acyl-sn-glycerol-3-phosphate acyltransferase [Bacteroidales bacterium]|nr:1-acyl-sn-glycerol-3-phosphate acyltransferase [Bacteroidales bacterium]